MKADRLNHLRFVLAARAESSVNYTDRDWIRLATTSSNPERLAASWEGFACLDQEFQSLGLHLSSADTPVDMPYLTDQDVVEALQKGAQLRPYYNGFSGRDAILEFFGLSLRRYSQLCPFTCDGETEGDGLIAPVKLISELINLSPYITPFMKIFGRSR